MVHVQVFIYLIRVFCIFDAIHPLLLRYISIDDCMFAMARNKRFFGR
jgi:hypothetical protein